MIFSALLYALALGACITVAALAADRAAEALRLQRRFIWLAAILASVAWPLAAIVFARPRRSTEAVLQDAGPLTIALESISSFSERSADALGSGRLDAVLLLAWAAASGVLVIRLLLEGARVRSARRGWRQMQLDGTNVNIADNHGPALVLSGRTEIVIPSYALMFEPALRALILKHENEHLRARDPALLFVARFMLVLLPWNLAILWQARRLRLALEIDCDARVLRGSGDAERYAKLLFAIAQMRSASPLRATIALTEGSSQLERRIRAMKAIHFKRRWLVAVGALLFSGAALAVASEVRSPQRNAAGGLDRAVGIVRHRIDALDVPASGRTSVEPRLPGTRATTVAGADSVLQQQQRQRAWGAFYAREVDEQPRALPGNKPPAYPAELRAARESGSVEVTFVVDENGAVVARSINVLRTSHEAFAEALLQVLPGYKFTPAEMGAQPVRVWVTLPFEFILSSGGGEQRIPVPTRTPPSQTPPTPPTGNVSGAELRVATAGGSAGQGGYFHYEVEKSARVLPGNAPPRYPAELRSARVSGKVLVGIVIGTDGRADMSTFKVIETTHTAFAEAAEAALASYRFAPAEINGRAVRMRVQLPFEFALGKSGR